MQATRKSSRLYEVLTNSNYLIDPLIDTPHMRNLADMSDKRDVQALLERPTSFIWMDAYHDEFDRLYLIGPGAYYLLAVRTLIETGICIAGELIYDLKTMKEIDPEENPEARALAWNIIDTEVNISIWEGSPKEVREMVAKRDDFSRFLHDYGALKR